MSMNVMLVDVMCLDSFWNV